jgi:hypothetical protein
MLRSVFILVLVKNVLRRFALICHRQPLKKCFSRGAILRLNGHG